MKQNIDFGPFACKHIIYLKLKYEIFHYLGLYLHLSNWLEKLIESFHFYSCLNKLVLKQIQYEKGSAVLAALTCDNNTLCTWLVHSKMDPEKDLLYVSKISRKRVSKTSHMA